MTTVPETIVDLAADMSLDELARTCHEAGVLHRTKPRDVEEVLERRPRAGGATNLRTVMRGDVHVTLSTLERAFLKLLREAKLPLPETNRPAGEQDRRREREARARGDEFRRYTYRDVLEDPRYVLAELRALLA
ncbi:MAG: hypothetical protein ACJ77M_05520 [Thermoleophilaceae bacterium]